MNFYREIAEAIRTDKKMNSHYWDSIDTEFHICTERCLNELKELSMTDVAYDEQDVLDMSKMVGDVIIAYLEKHCGAEFPYVDGCF